jgi:hypothetical protein
LLLKQVDQLRLGGAGKVGHGVPCRGGIAAIGSIPLNGGCGNA